MSPEQLFNICSILVLPGWALLILAPWWKWTLRLISTVIVPLLLSGIYTYLIFTNLNMSPGGFGSLAEVSRLFENPYMLLAGWVHYLAFDLFVGCWEVRDALRLGIPHWYIVPCLIFTFLFGPIGLALYILLRLIMKGALFIEHDSGSDSEDTE